MLMLGLCQGLLGWLHSYDTPIYLSIYLYLSVCLSVCLSIYLVGISQANRAGLEKAPRWAKIVE